MDDLALFLPSPPRAARINSDLSSALAGSIGEIARASAFDSSSDGGAIGPACAAIAASPAVDALVYALHYEALKAALRHDRPGVHAALARLVAAPITAGSLRVLRWGDPAIDPRRAAAFIDTVNVDPRQPVGFAPVSGADFATCESALARALDLLDRAVPDAAGEMRELVREIVLVAADTERGADFGGATAFHAWGTLFLNTEHHRNVVEMAEGLAHETGHAVLFGIARGRPLAANGLEARHISPLRAEPRPLEGVVHAAFVSARTHYVLDRLLTSGLLTADEVEHADEALHRARQAFYVGLETIDAHAQLTPTGANLLRGARRYLRDEDAAPSVAGARPWT